MSRIYLPGDSRATSRQTQSIYASGRPYFGVTALGGDWGNWDDDYIPPDDGGTPVVDEPPVGGVTPTGLLSLPAHHDPNYSIHNLTGPIGTWTGRLWERLSSGTWATMRQSSIDNASDREIARQGNLGNLRIAFRANGDKNLLLEMDRWLQGYRSKLFRPTSGPSTGILGWTYRTTLEWHLAYGNIAACVELFRRNPNVTLTAPSGGETTLGHRAAWWVNFFQTESIMHPDYAQYAGNMHAYLTLAQFHHHLWRAASNSTSLARRDEIISRLRGNFAGQAHWIRFPFGNGRFGMTGNSWVATHTNNNRNRQLWTDYTFIVASVMMELAADNIHIINPAVFPHYRQEFVRAFAANVLDTSTHLVANDSLPFASGWNGENPRDNKLSRTGIAHDGQTHTILHGTERGKTRYGKTRLANYATYGYLTAWADNTDAIPRPGGVTETDKERIVKQYEIIHSATGGNLRFINAAIGLLVAHSQDRS